MVVQAATECGVSCFAYSACGEVKRYGKVLVMVDELGVPALDIGLEIGVGKERDGQGKIALRWGEIAESQCLVENVQSSASSWFFKAGGHATNGVDFEICVLAGAELSGGVERRSCVFGEVSEDGEGV